MLASLSFTLPFFFIVGFQHVGNQTVKFFWYWLFQGLLTFVMVYFGQFFAALCPSPQSAQGTRTVLYLHHTISHNITRYHGPLYEIIARYTLFTCPHSSLSLIITSPSPASPSSTFLSPYFSFTLLFSCHGSPVYDYFPLLRFYDQT